MEKALIAMSGGVDSSAAALLALEKGWDAEGVTLKMYGGGRLDYGSGADAADAKAVADALGIKHHVWDYGEIFEKTVADSFAKSYAEGKTPNPCVTCNKYIKFGRLMDDAKALGFTKIVTGHYAVTQRGENGRYLLKKAADAKKDQSYFLYALSQEQLAFSWFPLGEMSKEQARRRAQERGFVNAEKRDSQDICFIPDGKYGDFIEKYLGVVFPEGDFVDTEGKILGRHKGIIRYTVGKRRGLGLSLPEPMYVKGIDTENNRVILCRDRELFGRELTVGDVNLISVDEIKGEMRVRAKVRSSKAEMPASAFDLGGGRIKIIFDEPQRGITPGQSAVMYDGDTVVGGGIIE